MVTPKAQGFKIAQLWRDRRHSFGCTPASKLDLHKSSSSLVILILILLLFVGAKKRMRMYSVVSRQWTLAVIARHLRWSRSRTRAWMCIDIILIYLRAIQNRGDTTDIIQAAHLS